MEHYLLDTNVFFHVIEAIANNTPNNELQMLREGKCYISELTRIEIISVLGKHARGMSRQVQICDRVIDEKGEICGCKYYIPAQKKWKKRVIADWLKLIKDIVMGNCPFFSVEILPVTHEVCEAAGIFVRHALQHNFGSLDAMIAASAVEYKNRTGTELKIVTYDRKLLTAIKADNTISYLNLRASQVK